MPAPTSYTEQTLAEWMQRELLAVADALGWTATDHTAYTDAVERVQRVLGGTIESQTNMPRLEAVAKVEIWERVLSERAGDYKFSTLAGTDERQQAFEQAERQVKRWAGRSP